MTETRDDKMKSALLDGMERYGGDLSRWPDRALAKEAGAAALADRDMRARLDDARALDRGIGALRDAIDADIATSGSLDRVLAATRRKIDRRPFRRWSWVAAAMIVCAAGLGSLADLHFDGSDDARLQVVVVDPLVFGPMAVEE